MKNIIGACLFALASVYSPNMDYKDNNKNYAQYNIKTIDEDLDFDSFDIDEVCYYITLTSWCITEGEEFDKKHLDDLLN